jgi:hypothetical protein
MNLSTALPLFQTKTDGGRYSDSCSVGIKILALGLAAPLHPTGFHVSTSLHYASPMPSSFCLAYSDNDIITRLATLCKEGFYRKKEKTDRFHRLGEIVDRPAGRRRRKQGFCPGLS